MPSQSDYVLTSDAHKVLAEKGIIMRSRNSKLVAAFRRLAGWPIRTYPEPEKANHDLHLRNIAEETGELITAANAKDWAGLLDAMVDLEYVVIQYALDCGFDTGAAFDRVHEANMRKVGPDGKFIFNDYGKVMKPEGWEPPYLDDLAGVSGR